MQAHQRRESLLVLLAKHGYVSFRDLSEKLGVSEMTVRRDLRSLQEEGLVVQVAGGGQVARSAHEPAFMAKRVLQQAEKVAIAREALRLLEPGMTIGLSAGTTTWAFAQEIRGFQGLTFVTNSTNIALALSQNGFDDIILTGGSFRTPSDALVGPFAEATVAKLHTDMFFLGVHGMDLQEGVSTPNILEASMNRKMMERASSVTVLFDHTKWSVQALAHIAHVDEIDVFVTDDGGGQAEVEALQMRGGRVLLASVDGGFPE